MKALDPGLFKDTQAVVSSISTSRQRKGKNQNPHLVLNKTQKQENINKAKISIAQATTEKKVFERHEDLIYKEMQRRQMTEPS